MEKTAGVAASDFGDENEDNNADFNDVAADDGRGGREGEVVVMVLLVLVSVLMLVDVQLMSLIRMKV